MKKLVLNLEELSVDSFETAAVETPRGTVMGAADDSGDCSRYCGTTIFEYIWERTWLN